MLKKYHPIWINTNFNHPKEITDESKMAIAELVDNGFPIGNQTVLLKGINDNVEVMRELVHKLVCNRVRPYYLYQCDKAVGINHFRTEAQKGIEIIKGLSGHTTGFAVPQYVIDMPDGGGKIPVSPQYLLKIQKEKLFLENFEGNRYQYDNPKEGEV